MERAAIQDNVSNGGAALLGDGLTSKASALHRECGKVTTHCRRDKAATCYWTPPAAAVCLSAEICAAATTCTQITIAIQRQSFASSSLAGLQSEPSNSIVDCCGGMAEPGVVAAVVTGDRVALSCVDYGGGYSCSRVDVAEQLIIIS